jgi:hypothetical protein
MFPIRKDRCTTATPVSQDPTPQRPQTLLQRFSSSFSSMIPNIRSQRRNSKTSIANRPETAPTSYQRGGSNIISSQSRVLPGSQQSLNSQINIPKLSNSGGNCAHDASTYYSFPSIEQQRCDLCGLRPSSKAAGSCIHCRPKSSISHIASVFRRSRDRGTDDPTAQSSLAKLIESSTPSEQGPRPVSDAAAAKRIGNPPRKASLPGGRRPSYNTLRPDSAQRGSSQSAVRPISPKLHHLHGLPGAKASPYVHKREVDAHLAALRAGAPSPLRRSADESKTSADHRESQQDYSQTIYYGNTTSSAPGRSSHRFGMLSVSRTQVSATTVERVQAHGNIIIEEGRRGGIPTTFDLELQRSQVYQRRSPHPTPPPARPQRIQEEDSDADFSTLTTQTPSTVGGKRLELKGGNEKPRLRGGNGDDQTHDAGLAFKLKKWLLTCRIPHRSRHAYDTDSDADLPPPRAPAPERILRTVRRNSGRARLPSVIDKRANQTLSHLTSSTHQTVPYASSRFTRTQLADSPINQPADHPAPNLRGGSGGSSVRLPPTLYWFAGGRGEPVTISSWQKQRGKRRRGGVLGMALYGVRAGMAYEEDGRGGGKGHVGIDGGDGAGRAGAQAVVAGVGPGDGEAKPASVASNSTAPGVESTPEAKGKGKERAIEEDAGAGPANAAEGVEAEVAQAGPSKAVDKKSGVVVEKSDEEEGGVIVPKAT